jgi:hypothetical protein
MIFAEMIPAVPTRYAILFSGGINTTYNYARYWNDLKFMYKTLTNTLGFSKDKIAVLYADGKAKDNDMPVHYSATQANLKTVFDLLRKNSTEKDLVFFFSTNHGGGFMTNDPDKKYNVYGGSVETGTEEPNDSISEATYKMDLNNDGDKNDTVAWDEVLNAWKGTSATASDAILDDDLQPMFSNLKFNRMVIVMEQCFSGGLIHDVARSNNRVIISAASEYESSWCMTGGTYNEFSYYFTSAINKADPSGTKVDADTNKDGDVSLVEAFNYARSKDSKSETPYYEDSGDGIPHSGAMPGGGEGTLGGSVTLEP